MSQIYSPVSRIDSAENPIPVSQRENGVEWNSMSLPAMDSQPTLFGSVPSVAGALFSEDDRYRLFARKVWPVLAGTRAAVEMCYCPDNGQPGVGTVLLLGVLVL